MPELAKNPANKNNGIMIIGAMFVAVSADEKRLEIKYPRELAHKDSKQVISTK